MTRDRAVRLLIPASLLTLLAIGLLLPTAGCSNRPGWVPNEDVALRRKENEFVRDSMGRFPFPEATPRGTATARAEVDYMYEWVGVANLSDEPWKDAEVWVNRQYVVHVPSWNKHDLKRLDFDMLRDERGNPFESNKLKNPVKRVEVHTGGKMYDVPVVLAD